MSHSFFAAAPKGLEELLTQELLDLGIDSARVARAGVRFQGELDQAYLALLWSRLASRITLPLMEFRARDEEELYEALRGYDWEREMSLDQTFVFDADLHQSPLTNSHYVALKAKDALCDFFKDRCGERPNVNPEDPDLKFHVFMEGHKGLLSLDLSGPPLFMRGYRAQGGVAPIKESLASGLLYRCRWPEIAKAGGSLFDPFCGSGTLLIEAVQMALRVAPGLSRRKWGFSAWKGHQPELWKRLCTEAEAMELRSEPPTIIGFDQDAKAIELAYANLGRAGFPGMVQFERRRLDQFSIHPSLMSKGGLILTNPPYGERLGEKEALRSTYKALGKIMAEKAQGFELAVFTGNPELGKEMGLLAYRTHKFYNGSIECRLLRFKLEGQQPLEHKKERPLEDREPDLASLDFSNRLKKNLKKLEPWAQKEGITCYRIYDRDLPEYNVSIDLYQDQLYISEFEAPPEMDQQVTRHRLEEILLRLHQDFAYPKEALHLKKRRKQKGKGQYEKFEEEERLFEVQEGGLRFWVDLNRYLDTGLFLDHRITRARLRELAKGQDFLNLFCYTGSASVYAAQGGARSTTSVDLSTTYLDWAEKNLKLNGFVGPHHHLIKADVIAWLGKEHGKYGLIFCDPPTFSNSKAMEGFFEVQKDHVGLIWACVKRLTPGGTLVFSNNFRGFKLDLEALSGLKIQEISHQTLPKDFERNPKIHKTFLIQKT